MVMGATKPLSPRKDGWEEEEDAKPATAQGGGWVMGLGFCHSAGLTRGSPKPLSCGMRLCALDFKAGILLG